MEFQIGEIDGPNQRGDIIHHAKVYIIFVMLAIYGHGLDPIGAKSRTFLFIKERRFHAVWVALESERTVFKMRQHHRRDAKVIINDLSLGKTGPGIKNLAQIGKLYLVPVDLERARITVECLPAFSRSFLFDNCAHTNPVKGNTLVNIAHFGVRESEIFTEKSGKSAPSARFYQRGRSSGELF